MDRRNFITITGLTAAGLMIPLPGRLIAAEALVDGRIDVAIKKALADRALAAATAAGASYCASAGI